MPTDACQFFYRCEACGLEMKPKKGDCCVFCSYGDVPCPPIQEERGCCTSESVTANKRDWASGLTLAAVWGVPAAAMLLALPLEPTARGVVWIAMLVWMGAACFANSRRCDRTHCRYTGPFFVAMAALVLLFMAGLLPLGSQPWLVLGLSILVGNALLWWGSEKLLGTYSRRRS